jgi:plasmid stabilization system protein ParE
MAEVRWTEESVQWLRDIYDYIASDNPAAATRVVDSIYQKAQVLIDQPRIGYKYHSASGREVRILLYGHYRITYLIKESGDIDILGIFHGALDIDRYLV